MPDLNIAIHNAIPTPIDAARRPTGRKRNAISTPRRPIAAANAGTDTWLV